MAKKIELAIDEIVDLYTVQKITAVEIAKRFNVCIGTILDRLKEQGVPQKFPHSKHSPNSSHKKVVDANSLAEIIKLYTDDHLSSVEIGKRFDMSFPAVIRILRANNIPIVDSRRDKKHFKHTIKEFELPSIIKNFHDCSGEITCPDCGKTRRRHLTRPIIEEIIKNKGICHSCITKLRTINLNLEHIATLYNVFHFTILQISKKFKVSTGAIRRIMRENGIIIREKGETKKILHKDTYKNKGTLENPILGDKCQGTDIGLNDPSYYIYIECPICHELRWQGLSHFKRNGGICENCCKNPTVNNKGTLENPEIGDIQHGSKIGKGDNYYKLTECPECHNLRWKLKDRGIKETCPKCSTKIRGLNHRGEKSPAWKGGLAMQGYPTEWNENLKETIRVRDNHICQLCGNPQNGLRLAVHHIDYNKLNLISDNLISLCPPSNKDCHTKTNHNRKFWTEFFQLMIEEKRQAEIKKLVNTLNLYLCQAAK